MFYFGVDYYPEHWPQERWPEDARLMAEAGMNVARLAEFAWSKLEPRDGEYDFAWLDRAIEILAGEGLRVVLGTPTASPPPWLMARHPDAFLTRADGRPVSYGNRRNYSPNSKAYREHSRRITEAMAGHYRDNPAVIGWQIDNEFGDRDYDAPAFRDWLRRRFGSIDAVNERWGTMFWSHVYREWGEIPVPLTTGGKPNPGLALDFCRFCSESYADFQRDQVEILRKVCPGHFITHNLMGFKYDLIDYYHLARDLDFVAWDNYPRGFWNLEEEVDPYRMALGHDTMRGLKGKPFWVMEQQAGAGGWDVVGVAPRPGELRLWALQAVAHGADALLFFRWRTARYGTEQYWHGLLEHDGRPGRRYREIAELGRELKGIGDRLAGATTTAEVAMLHSYDSRFALQIQPNNPRLGYGEQFLGIYRSLAARNLSIDVVGPDADLSGYRAVVAPSLHVLTGATASALRDFVAAGGTLLATVRSGVKDEANAVVDRPLPGLLAEICGATVEEYDSLPEEARVPVRFEPEGAPHAASTFGYAWCDVLALNGARPLASYGAGHYAGKPAIAINGFGEGRAIYVGTVGDAALNDALADLLLEQAGVERGVATPSGVEAALRRNGRPLLFLLNHGDSTRTVSVDPSYRSLLGPESNGGTVTLEPRGAAIVEGDESA